jgi:methylated-DNA-[protein]-cysteine S-methyltransferase
VHPPIRFATALAADAMIIPATPSGAPFAAVLALPFGALGVYASADALVELVFLPPDTPLCPPASYPAERAAVQLAAWLNDPDYVFDLPLAPRGTPFQRRVWHAIATIPRGQRATYGTLARQLGTASRAVGQACGANPFPIVVPCHRVVSAGGMGGFAGATEGYLLDAKRWLLDFETRR